MTCTLDRFTRYDVSEVFTANGRVIARLSSPPPGCPDGTMNNSKTVQQESPTVVRPTLVFDTQRGVPIVLVPASHHATPAPDADAHDSHGAFFWACMIFGGVALVYLGIRIARWFLSQANAMPPRQTVPHWSTGGGPDGYAYATSRPIYRERGSNNTTVMPIVVGNNFGGSSPSYPPACSPPSPPSTPTSYSSDTSSSPSTYSSDSGSSYSSDSSSSYSSDSSSSYSSDSSSSTSSDSSSSFSSDD